MSERVPETLHEADLMIERLEAEVARLRALVKNCRPLVAASRSWKAGPIVEQIDRALEQARKE